MLERFSSLHSWNAAVGQLWPAACLRKLGGNIKAAVVAFSLFLVVCEKKLMCTEYIPKMAFL